MLYRLSAFAFFLFSPSVSSFGPPSLPDSNSIRRITELAMVEEKTTPETKKPEDIATDNNNPLKTKKFESEHSLGELKYKAVADWITLRKIHKPVAEMFYTAYLLQSKEEIDTDVSSRPLTFVFNGGPGAASAYMHMGAAGPQRVQFGTHGELPPPPTRVVDNDETWLGFTDLVFIDPIGTGFSRALDQSKKAKQADEEEGKGPQENPEFWDIDKDLDSLMKVFVCHGTYDLVTPYFHSERLVGLMKLTEQQKQKQLSTRHYQGGHMFYSWDASRKAFRDDIQQLYEDATGGSVSTQ